MGKDGGSICLLKVGSTLTTSKHSVTTQKTVTDMWTFNLIVKSHHWRWCEADYGLLTNRGANSVRLLFRSQKANCFLGFTNWVRSGRDASGRRFKPAFLELITRRCYLLWAGTRDSGGGWSLKTAGQLVEATPHRDRNPSWRLAASHIPRDSAGDCNLLKQTDEAVMWLWSQTDGHTNNSFTSNDLTDQQLTRHGRIKLFLTTAVSRTEYYFLVFM